jgi:hypothetical protein
MNLNVTHRLTRTLCALGLALVATAALGWLTPAFAEEAAPAAAPPAPPAPPPPAMDPACGCCVSPCDLPPDGCPCPKTCIPDPLFSGGCLDDCIKGFEKAKAASCFSISAGAYHWFNYSLDNEEFTYGYPGAEGTYFYYLEMDFACPRCGECAPQWGFHGQVRFRDESLFRTFFEEQVWLYEGYFFVDFPTIGKFKAGKIWKRFGYDWDGTFWGNVPYYDGMKLDPDWGVSWEKVWNAGKRFEVNAFLQFFAMEDGVNGSIAGADPESTGVFDEENTFVARVQPRWRFTKNMSLAVGVSALWGQVTGQVAGAGDDDLLQYAADVEFQWCGLKAFAEYAHSDGTQNPAHYVTGGPSDIYDTLWAGIEYKIGPFTPRVVWSHGEYENPGGSQDILLAGGTVELTSWLTLYLEYVHWTVQADGGPEIQFEDGVQIVLNWYV